MSYIADKSVSGYEVTYSANEKFTKSKIMTVKKPSSSRITITGIKSGKIYYARIRAYYIKNGKKIYGDYGYTDNVWVR